MQLEKMQGDRDISEVMEPLVSVVVVTYNSSATVLETLESVLAQSYRKIELIITDDCSTDATVTVCEQWLFKNADRFVKTQVRTVDKNTGIPSNCNRGLNMASGSWVKFIAGDDVLMPDCVTDNIEFVTQHPAAKLVQSRCDFYTDTFEAKNFSFTLSFSRERFFAEQTSAASQHQLLLLKNWLLAPSVFVHTASLTSSGGFDEKLRYKEDWPLWLNMTRSGIKVHYFDKVTIKYRRSNDSVMKMSQPFMSKAYAVDSLVFHSIYIQPHVTFFVSFRYKLSMRLIIFFNDVGLNRNSLLSKLIFSCLYKIKP